MLRQRILSIVETEQKPRDAKEWYSLFDKLLYRFQWVSELA